MEEGGYLRFTRNLYRKSGIFRELLFLLWMLSFVDHGICQKQCGQASSSYSLPMASLCYKTNATAGRVVLDGFLTHDSTTSPCECSLTSTHSTSVDFTALNALQPGYTNCGSSITVTNGGTSFTINCFILGTVSVSPTQTVSLSFYKPEFGYDSSYCMLLTPDNSNAVLSLNCNGDLNFPTTSTSAPAPPTTTTTTTTTTTKAPTTTTTTSTTTTKPITTTTIRTTTQQPAATTTTTEQPATTTRTTTTVATTTKATTSEISTAEPTQNPPTRPTAAPTTTKASAVTITSSSDEWSYVIPAIGAGVVIVLAVVVAVCYSHRKKQKYLSSNINGMYAFDNKLNSPYSRKNDDGPGMTSTLSASKQMNAIIVDDVRDDVSVSTNLSEGTFIRHSVRQPIGNDGPMYAVVNKPVTEDIPPPDTMDTEVKQTTESNMVY